MAPNRVEQIALHARRLAQATGVPVVEQADPASEGLDGITSDLDIEALAKGLVDVSRDLDLYLKGLLEPVDAPVVQLKKDISRLEAEIREKDALIARTVGMVRGAEKTMGQLKKAQLRTLYNL